MKKNSGSKPTESELEILQLLWEHGSSTVRSINELQNEQTEKQTGYTTTLKLMQIMNEKKLVKRDTESRTHVYEAAVQEQDIQRQLLDRFMDMTFRGSAKKMIMQALGNGSVSDDELREVKELIDQLEKKDNKKNN